MLCQMLVEWLFVLPYVMVCALLASLESIAIPHCSACVWVFCGMTAFLSCLSVAGSEAHRDVFGENPAMVLRHSANDCCCACSFLLCLMLFGFL